MTEEEFADRAVAACRRTTEILDVIDDLTKTIKVIDSRIDSVLPEYKKSLVNTKRRFQLCIDALKQMDYYSWRVPMDTPDADSLIIVCYQYKNVRRFTVERYCFGFQHEDDTWEVIAWKYLEVSNEGMD